jgi:hypothetical protein
MFKSKAPKCVINMNFINLNSFCLLIMKIKILFNFEKEWCTFDMEKKCLKKEDCPQAKIECFKHVKGLLNISNLNENFTIEICN